MSEERVFTIPGEPKPKGRPRFSSRGPYVVTYTDGKTVAYENLVALEYEKAYPHSTPFEGGVSLSIRFYFPLLKSDYWPVNKNHHGELRQSGIDKLNGKIPHISKPDLTNLAKSIEDGLNHTSCWRDDSQICKEQTEKGFSETPHVDVTIKEV